MHLLPHLPLLRPHPPPLQAPPQRHLPLPLRKEAALHHHRPRHRSRHRHPRAAGDEGILLWSTRVIKKRLVQSGSASYCDAPFNWVSGIIREKKHEAYGPSPFCFADQTEAMTGFLFTKGIKLEYVWHK